MRFNKQMSNSREENLKRIIHLMQTDDSADAPEHAVKWSKDIFRTRAAEPRRSMAERLTAVLKIDLVPGKTVFGERSATAEARQMFFEAGRHAVDLRISGSASGSDVKGQILGDGFGNCTVKFGGQSVRANEQSEFELKGIAKGTYDLVLGTDELEILIEGIEIF